MTYDLADRLTGIDAAGSANDATFSVDALGRIRSRVVNGTTDTYSYVGTSEVVTRIATGGATLDSIVTSAGDRLAVRSAGTLNWLVPDLHGNVASALSADEATVVHAIRYDAWGETIGTGTAGGSAVGAGVWTYQGRLDVSPTGLGTPLLDLSARFYAPGIGAFTSLDSVIGSVQHPLSMNRFLYAHANPATLVDPTGHYAMEAEYGYTAKPSTVGRELNMSCRSRGDHGCGATAARSTKASVRKAAPRPAVQPRRWGGGGRAPRPHDIESEGPTRGGSRRNSARVDWPNLNPAPTPRPTETDGPGSGPAPDVCTTQPQNCYSPKGGADDYYPSPAGNVVYVVRTIVPGPTVPVNGLMELETFYDLQLRYTISSDGSPTVTISNAGGAVIRGGGGAIEYDLLSGTGRVYGFNSVSYQGTNGSLVAGQLNPRVGGTGVGASTLRVVESRVGIVLTPEPGYEYIQSQQSELRIVADGGTRIVASGRADLHAILRMRDDYYTWTAGTAVGVLQIPRAIQTLGSLTSTVGRLAPQVVR